MGLTVHGGRHDVPHVPRGSCASAQAARRAPPIHPRARENLGARITEVQIAFLVFYVKYLDRPIRVFCRMALACIGLAAVDRGHIHKFAPADCEVDGADSTTRS
jgi:hypothetical protein